MNLECMLFVIQVNNSGNNHVVHLADPSLPMNSLDKEGKGSPLITSLTVTNSFTSSKMMRSLVHHSHLLTVSSQCYAT